MKEENITEQTIKHFVDMFYGKVHNDSELGPFFTSVMEDSNDIWETHLERMYAFWSSIMLGSGHYKGNPFRKHKELPAFDISFFDRWLKLFAETAYEIHTPHIAVRYIEKSRLIAQSLKQGLYALKPDSDFLIEEI